MGSRGVRRGIPRGVARGSECERLRIPRGVAQGFGGEGSRGTWLRMMRLRFRSSGS